jgi:hypothetical protein
MIELNIARGPLPTSELETIGRTYGRVDSRFQSVAFCRALFNENPFGFAYHVFALDRSTVVGHYAVIPIRVTARGRQFLSGKGEALYVEEEYRTASIDGPNGSFPLAFSLMQELHNHALRDGVVVLHNITSRDVGMLQRMDGFTRLAIRTDQYNLLLDSSRFPAIQSRAVSRFAGRTVSILQKVLARLLGLFLRLSAAPVVRVRVGSSISVTLAPLEPQGGSAAAQWTIARDPATLQWLHRIGRIEVLETGAEPCGFVAYTRGRVREILRLEVRPGHRRAGLALLCALVVNAERDGAALVTVGERTRKAHPGALRLGLCLLGFFRRSFPTEIYVKSTDPFFLAPGNIAFDRLFHLSGEAPRHAEPPSSRGGEP